MLLAVHVAPLLATSAAVGRGDGSIASLMALIGCVAFFVGKLFDCRALRAARWGVVVAGRRSTVALLTLTAFVHGDVMFAGPAETAVGPPMAFDVVLPAMAVTALVAAGCWLAGSVPFARPAPSRRFGSVETSARLVPARLFARATFARGPPA